MLLGQIQALEIQDVQLHLKITGMTEAKAPEIWREYLILTYKPEKPIRYVGAAFSTEDFREIHNYMYNSNGIYFLILPAPAEELITYRLVVDGIWETDPQNPRTQSDRNGLLLSKLEFSQPAESGSLSPVLMDSSRVRFHIRTSPGRQVYLAGDFNNWDPYMTDMDEIEPGTYSVTLNIKPGRYGYYYLIDGEPLTDPLNFQKSRSNAGEDISILYIPG